MKGYFMWLLRLTSWSSAGECLHCRLLTAPPSASSSCSAAEAEPAAGERAEAGAKDSQPQRVPAMMRTMIITEWQLLLPAGSGRLRKLESRSIFSDSCDENGNEIFLLSGSTEVAATSSRVALCVRRVRVVWAEPLASVAAGSQCAPAQPLSSWRRRAVRVSCRQL